MLRDGVPVDPPRDYFIPAEGETVRLDFSLDADEDDVRVYVVYDPDDNETAGTAVRVVNLGPLSGGVHSYEWDGRDDGGVIVQQGMYSFMVVAPTDPDSEVFVPASIFASRRIEVQ